MTWRWSYGYQYNIVGYCHFPTMILQKFKFLSKCRRKSWWTLWCVNGIIGKKGHKTQWNAILIKHYQEFCTIILIVVRHDTTVHDDMPECTCNTSTEEEREEFHWTLCQLNGQKYRIKFYFYYLLHLIDKLFSHLISIK